MNIIEMKQSQFLREDSFFHHNQPTFALVFQLQPALQLALNEYLSRWVRIFSQPVASCRKSRTTDEERVSENLNERNNLAAMEMLIKYWIISFAERIKPLLVCFSQWQLMSQTYFIKEQVLVMFFFLLRNDYLT